MKNKKNLVIVFLLLIALIVTVISIQKSRTIKDINERDFMYTGYSKFDLYQNYTINQVPNYVEINKIQQKNDFLFKMPDLEIGNKTFKSNIVVSENPLSFEYKFVSDYERDDSDVLDLGIISFNDEFEINDIQKVSDGYVITLSNEENDIIIEKYSNEFSNLWSYKVKLPKDAIEYNQITDFLEYKNQYLFVISYESKIDTRNYLLFLDNKGKFVFEDYCGSYRNSYLDAKNDRLYFDSIDTYNYIDLKENKVIEKFDRVQEPYYQKTDYYTMIGINDKNVYYYGQAAYDDFESLFKLDKKGNIEKRIDLRPLFKKEYNSKNQDITIGVTHVEDRFIVDYQVFDSEEGNGLYDGLLFLDEDFNVLKSISTKKGSDTMEELKNNDIYTIEEFNYTNGVLYVVFDLEIEGPLYAKYDSKGNKIFSEIYEDLYASNGSVGLITFNEKEIANYEEILGYRDYYIKLSHITLND